MMGMRIFHNFVHPHLGLNGKTPADFDFAGIHVEGENNWLALIQNARMKAFKGGK